MKIISYNVNGIRAAIKKGFLDWLKTHPADVICIQENKAQQSDISAKDFNDLGYHDYWFCAQKKGYSGVTVFSKIKLYISIINKQRLHIKPTFMA